MLQARDEQGRLVKKPGTSELSAMVANLGRGNAFVIVERVENASEGEWYAQVWLRDDNTYQVEFRDGTAAEHYQTLTVSQEKVIDALIGWAENRQNWKDTFTWNNIGDWFVDAD